MMCVCVWCCIKDYISSLWTYESERTSLLPAEHKNQIISTDYNQMMQRLRRWLQSMELNWNLARVIQSVEMIKTPLRWTKERQITAAATTTLVTAAESKMQIKSKYECSGSWAEIISFSRHLWVKESARATTNGWVREKCGKISCRYATISFFIAKACE